jgi:hypothetical protein
MQLETKENRLPPSNSGDAQRPTCWRLSAHTWYHEQVTLARVQDCLKQALQGFFSEHAVQERVERCLQQVAHMFTDVGDSLKELLETHQLALPSATTPANVPMLAA